MSIDRRNLLLGGLGITAAAVGGGLGIGVPHASAKPALEPTGGGAPTAKDWMASIDGHLPLAALTIPGTHDTCALRRIPFVRCQSYGPRDQLDMGVRFLDLRVNDTEDMEISHGPIKVDNSLVHVLKGCREFLDDHPSETILVSIKQEHTKSDKDRLAKRWKSTTKQFKDILYTSSHLPTLGTARGKVVVITRAAGVPGVPWKSATISDDYKVGSKDDAKNKKWPTVRKALEAAAKGSKKELHITFCSGTGAPDTDPGDVNDVMEPLLRTWLKKRPGRRGERLGVVVVDYAKKGKIEQIAARNFGRNSWS